MNGVDSTAATPQAFTAVTKGIRINMGVGNDTVTFGAADATAFSVAGYVQINMGRGTTPFPSGQ